MAKEKARKRIRFGTIYMIVSALFLSSCVAYYGYRFVYYYRLSHGKIQNDSVSLNEILTSTTNIVLDGDGLQVNGKQGYLYRGNPTDNYVWYSGIMWRIMSIDAKGNIKLVANEVVTDLVWDETDNEYDTSRIRAYLNPIEGDDTSGVFYNILSNPDTYLTVNETCIDKTGQATEFSDVCRLTTTDDYVGLLTAKDYWMAGGVESYLNIGTRQWLATAVSGATNEDGTTSDETRVYYIYTEGGIGNTSESSTDKYSFGVRPTITLKSTATVDAGSGTETDPYRLESTVLDNETTYYLGERNVGSYFNYSGYTWRIVGTENGKTKAIMMDVIRKADGTVYKRKFADDTALYSTKDGNIGYYLNNNFVKTLENSSYLAKGTFYTGPYTMKGGYTDAKLKSKTVKAKVGMPTIGELFSNNIFVQDEYTPDEIVYWTVNYKNSSQQLVWLAREYDWLFADFSDSKYAVRPVIYLKDNIIVSSGEGTPYAPYEITEGPAHE